MESLFLESHGVLEQINSLFVQLERHVGYPDEVQIEQTIQQKIEELNQYASKQYTMSFINLINTSTCLATAHLFIGNEKVCFLFRTFDRLEVYVMKELPNKRQASRLKLNQLKYDSSHLTVS